MVSETETSWRGGASRSTVLDPMVRGPGRSWRGVIPRGGERHGLYAHHESNVETGDGGNGYLRPRKNCQIDLCSFTDGSELKEAQRFLLSEASAARAAAA